MQCFAQHVAITQRTRQQNALQSSVARCPVQVRRWSNVRKASMCTDEGAALFPDELAQRSVVFLGSQRIGDTGAAAVGAALKIPNTSIISVNVDHCGIGCDGAIAIAEGLCGNEVLEELVMMDNEVGDRGATALASALAKPGCRVRCLYLVGNRIGIKGGIALGKMLCVNKSLQTVYLHGQLKKGGGIGDQGALAWAQGIAANRGAFWFLNLNRNGITAKGLDALRAARVQGKHTVFPVDPYPR